MRVKEIIKRAILTYFDVVVPLLIAGAAASASGATISVSAIEVASWAALPAVWSVLRNAFTEIPAVNIPVLTTLPPAAAAAAVTASASDVPPPP